MANYLVQDTSLAAVGDAIRTLTGRTEKLVFPDDFISALDGLKILPTGRAQSSSTLSWDMQSIATGTLQEV